jgi:predicted ATPase
MGNIGSRGQYTVDYLETRGNEEVEFENLIHPDTASSLNNVGQTVRDKRLINQVTLWMREISPGIGIRTTSVSGDNVKLEYEYEQKTFGKTNTFKPENVGFGISYALHVVVSLLKAKPGSLIIIENPESHVHPRGQAELGKLIALLAKNDVQIIVETHSDHILNGIRVGVKEDSSLKDRTILFYFDKEFTDTEQYSRITEIKIDKNGTLSHYPDNLLTEWSNMLARLV